MLRVDFPMSFLFLPGFLQGRQLAFRESDALLGNLSFQSFKSLLEGLQVMTLPP
jgi:hypothetical protein